MYFLGIDIGAVSAKAVILRESDPVAMTLIDTGPHVMQIADAVMKSVLKELLAFHRVRKAIIEKP